MKKDFVGFKEALAFSESRGIYNITNKYGYLGKYQFGKRTLKFLKIYNTKEFLNNPELQEKAFEQLCKINKRILKNEIEKYRNTIIDGVTITESGILAAAHLAGATNVKKFLRSEGKNGFRDGFGTSIKSYFKKFGGYDTSYIKIDYTC